MEQNAGLLEKQAHELLDQGEREQAHQLLKQAARPGGVGVLRLEALRNALRPAMLAERVGARKEAAASRVDALIARDPAREREHGVERAESVRCQDDLGLQIEHVPELGEGHAVRR